MAQEPHQDVSVEEKSYKREVAISCLLFGAGLVLLSVGLVLFDADGMRKVKALESLITTVIGITVPSALAVFAVHHIVPRGGKDVSARRRDRGRVERDHRGDGSTPEVSL
jgi:hypothetical protein